MANVQLVQSIVDAFKRGTEVLQKNAHVYDMEKKAFVPMGPPQGPMTGDPNAMPPQGGGMPPQGAPMPPQGAPMPPAGDPNAMPPQGAPMDPNAMPPQGAPMDPNAAAGGAPMPPQGGGMPPEMESALSDLASGVETTAQTAQQTQTQVDQLAQRQLANEQEISELREQLKNPAPFEGASKDTNEPAGTPTKETPMDGGLQSIAPQQIPSK